MQERSRDLFYRREGSFPTGRVYTRTDVGKTERTSEKRRSVEKRCFRSQRSTE